MARALRSVPPGALPIPPFHTTALIVLQSPDNPQPVHWQIELYPSSVTTHFIHGGNEKVGPPLSLGYHIGQIKVN